METHITEEQQIAALRQWWKENGASIVTGVVLGLAALFALKAWYAWQEQTARNASDVYSALTRALQAGDNTLAEERAAVLMNEYARTSYADFAALALAKIHIEDNTLDAAATQLQWVLDHGKQEFIRDVARLRLARVKLAQGEADAALAVLGKAGEGGDTRGPFAELRGDIELARGNRTAALDAYMQALALTGNDYPGHALLQLKRDDVAARMPVSTGAAQ